MKMLKLLLIVLCATFLHEGCGPSAEQQALEQQRIADSIAADHSAQAAAASYTSEAEELEKLLLNDPSYTEAPATTEAAVETVYVYPSAVSRSEIETAGNTRVFKITELDMPAGFSRVYVRDDTDPRGYYDVTIPNDALPELGTILVTCTYAE